MINVRQGVYFVIQSIGQINSVIQCHSKQKLAWIANIVDIPTKEYHSLSTLSQNEPAFTSPLPV